MISCILLLISCGWAWSSSVPTLNPIVSTTYGYVSGQLLKSRGNKEYASFTGIPFAQPPVRALRFANPQPPAKWSGVLNTTYYASRCIQRNYMSQDDPPIIGSEDCLYLNVYVPQVETTEKLPVMVHIHYGGLFAGGSDDGYLGPAYFMDYPMVLVTFNYRLGVFGFLSTIDDEAPGNYGLKDQVLALKWVQENIASFGGDPNKVTICGQSAGAGSVHLHYVSQSSNGLFSKGISQSGNALALWATPNNPVQAQVTGIQAQLVNCSTTDGTAEVVECLRNVPAETLLATQSAFKTFHRFPFNLWGTVLETKTQRNPDPFLTESPLQTLSSGSFKRLPWLVGSVENEGLLVASSSLTVPQETLDLNSHFKETMISLLGLGYTNNDTNGAFESISNFFYLGAGVDVNNQTSVKNFIDLWSDRYFFQSLYQTLNLQVNNGHDSIYLYYFEYRGEEHTFASWFSTEPNLYKLNLGPSHCDELLYQFSSRIFPDIQNSSNIDFSHKWLEMWVNFATYGNPNPPQNIVLSDIDWQPLSKQNSEVLENGDIVKLSVLGSASTGASFNMSRGFYPERMSFWEKVAIQF